MGIEKEPEKPEEDVEDIISSILDQDLDSVEASRLINEKLVGCKVHIENEAGDTEGGWTLLEVDIDDGDEGVDGGTVTVERGGQRKTISWANFLKAN